MTTESPPETIHIVTLNNNVLDEGIDYKVLPSGSIQLMLDLEDDDRVVHYELIGKKRVLHEP